MSPATTCSISPGVSAGLLQRPPLLLRVPVHLHRNLGDEEQARDGGAVCQVDALDDLAIAGATHEISLACRALT